jgi:hypothetical protein
MYGKQKRIVGATLALVAVGLAGCNGNYIPGGSVISLGVGSYRATLAAIPEGVVRIKSRVYKGGVFVKSVESAIGEGSGAVLINDLASGSDYVIQLIGYDAAGRALASLEKLGITIISDGERGDSWTLTNLPLTIASSAYTIGGAAAVDPDLAGKIRLTLNALINKTTGSPLKGLTAANFCVVEDDVVRGGLEVSGLDASSRSKADIAFIIDTTGSMSSQIAGVKNSVAAFADALIASGIDLRIGGIEYGDDIRTKKDFTTSATDFKTWVSTLAANGGSDEPENPLDSLVSYVDGSTWRPDAQHIVIVITDAHAHEKGDGTTIAHYTEAEVVAKYRGNYVIHTLSPSAIRSVKDNDGVSIAQSRAVGVYPGVKPLSDGTGGTWTDLPFNGTVNLSALPVKDAITSGYLLRYSGLKIAGTHNLRLILKQDGSNTWSTKRIFQKSPDESNSHRGIFSFLSLKCIFSKELG